MRYLTILTTIRINGFYTPQDTYVACIVYSTLVWLIGIYVMRVLLKALLTYKGLLSLFLSLSLSLMTNMQTKLMIMIIYDNDNI